MFVKLSVLTFPQTLRFVKSLPKRERQPLESKFTNAEPTGKCRPRRTGDATILTSG